MPANMQTLVQGGAIRLVAGLLFIVLLALMVAGNAMAQEKTAPNQAPEWHSVRLTDRAVTVIWIPVDDPSITGYELQKRDVGSTTWLVANRGGPKVRAYADHGGNGVKREYRVRAFNAMGTGPWSTVKQATTPLYKPTPTPERIAAQSSPTPMSHLQGTTTPAKRVPFRVRNLAVTASGTSATVTWDKSALGKNKSDVRCRSAQPRKYRYFVTHWTRGQTVIPYTETAEQTLTVTGLIPGHRYAVSVWSYSEECNNWSEPRREFWRQP